jgi:hypothetical protein
MIPYMYRKKDDCGLFGCLIVFLLGIAIIAVMLYSAYLESTNKEKYKESCNYETYNV